MTTSTDQLQEREAGPTIRDGAAAVVAVVVAALLLAYLDDMITPSAWHDPLLWILSGAGTVAVQATLWARSRRALAPMGALLLAGAAYATSASRAGDLWFLVETPLAWVTGVVCLATGLAWHWLRSS